jgi:hypothetical protein
MSKPNRFLQHFSPLSDFTCRQPAHTQPLCHIPAAARLARRRCRAPPWGKPSGSLALVMPRSSAWTRATIVALESHNLSHFLRRRALTTAGIYIKPSAELNQSAPGPALPIAGGDGVSRMPDARRSWRCARGKRRATSGMAAARKKPPRPRVTSTSLPVSCAISNKLRFWAGPSTSAFGGKRKTCAPIELFRFDPTQTLS